jgi:DNA-binding transcriptional MerR regulator
MAELKSTKKDLISSIELLSKTGISRATLNNYIKMGMIPPPMVMKPNDPHSKAKRIGYFGYPVVETIETIKHYKKTGQSIKEIRSHLSMDNQDRETWTEPSVQKESDSTTTSTPEKSISNTDTLLREYESRIPCMDIERPPKLRSLVVLVANLQSSMKICSQLPSEEYVLLNHQVWRLMEDSLKRYSGLWGNYVPGRAVFYFLNDANGHYLMNSILCAVELKKKMKGLSNHWTSNKGWSEELCLNVGIDCNEEYFGKIPDLFGSGWMSFGVSVECAIRLSELSTSGTIWITKKFLDRLNERERKKIRFGIRKDPLSQHTLIENTFSRIMDLFPPTTPYSQRLREIDNTSVTSVIDLLGCTIDDINPYPQ